MKKIIYLIMILVLSIVIAGSVYAQVPVGVIHASYNNSDFEKKFVNNIVEVIEERENLEYLEKHNDEQLLLIINTFGSEDVILYDVTYIYSLKDSVISYFISKYTGTDNPKTIEKTPEKIISDLEMNFYGWLNYMSD